MMHGHYSFGKKLRGMSLIELMIALTLGMFLILIIIKIAMDNKSSFRLQEAMARTQEVGRFAMDIISRDIRNTDYWGCLKNRSSVTNNLNPAGTNYADYPVNNGISGTDDSATGNSFDTITLSSAFGASFEVETPYMANEYSNIKVPSNTALNQGDILLISTCSSGDLFQISNTNPQSGTIIHNTGNSTTPGNINSGSCSGGGTSHCLSTLYEDDATVYVAQALTYSIGTDSHGESALVRKLNAGSEDVLVAGIENLQFLYGEDTDNDNIVNIYRTANNVASWDDVLSVQVSILVYSKDGLLPTPAGYDFNGTTTVPTDRRFRRTFTSTVTLRNRI